MSAAMIIGLLVLALIILIAVKQRFAKYPRRNESGRCGGVTYVDSGAGPADCSSDGGGGGGD